MTSNILRTFKFSVFIILLANAVWANEFDYKIRDSNRMEGFRNDIPTASLDLRVVSFVSYRENRSPSPNDRLKLKFFVPSEDPIFISVSEIVPLRYYYMEPVRTQWQRGWQTFDGWAVNAVLLPQAIRNSSLGVVARLQSNEPGSGLLTPVLIYLSSHPAAVSAYKLRIVSRETLSTLSYRLKRWKAVDIHTTKIISEDPADFIAAETPITMKLNLGGEKAGWFELWIDARIKDQIEGPRGTYYFYHQPAIGTAP